MSPSAPLRPRRLSAALVGVLVCAAVGACKREPKTPAEAYARFAAAVRARDGEALFGALDVTSRWSFMTIRRAHREAYDVILSNFPEEPERQRRARRFELAALSDSDAAFFAAYVTEARWNELGRGLPGAAAAPAIAARGDEATVATSDGRALVFRSGERGVWGFAGFSEEAEGLKGRATADLEQIRTSAADYERAATRSGR